MSHPVICYSKGGAFPMMNTVQGQRTQNCERNSPFPQRSRIKMGAFCENGAPQFRDH